MIKYAFLLVLLCQGSYLDQKLNIEVLFESLCPDSLRFIQEQLYPAWNDISDYVNIQFVPFGKSSSLEGGAKFVCQHGPQECKGNRIMSCALQYLPEQDRQIEFVHCFMDIYRKGKKNAQEYGQICAEKVNLDISLVKQCYNSAEGTNLQLAAEKATTRILPHFIPTVHYNGEFHPQLQEISLVNFRGLVCELIKKAFPESCKTSSILRL